MPPLFLQRTGRFASWTTFFTACGVWAANTPPPASALNGTRPNVIYILIDDLGWTDLGCMGSDFYQTPNIDRLRSQGMLFTDSYGAAPVCAPARASILTGRYPVRTTITDVFMPKKAVRMTPLIDRVTGRNLPLEEITSGQMMKGAGYATACIGKWHVGGAVGSRPQDKGFDFVVSPRGKDDPGDYKSVKRYTDAALSFIEKHKDGPFYVYIGHDVVHLPYRAPADLVAKYEQKLRPGLHHTYPTYAATIEYLDQKVGELMDKLDEWGLADNTLVIFTSDNGGRASNYDYRLVTRNDPLRAGKHTLYEGALRVPFIARWPGKIPANTTNRTPIHQVDMYPTLAALAGRDLSAYPQVDGCSIAPLLEGKSMPERTFFWFYPHYNIAPTYGRNSMVEYMRPAAVILDGEWKLIEWFEDPLTVELYNVREDPGELTNMAFSKPEKVAKLREKLAQWYGELDIKLPEKRADYDPDRANSVLWRYGEPRYESVSEKYMPPGFPVPPTPIK